TIYPPPAAERAAGNLKSEIENPMATPDNLVVIYKELADWHERQAQPQMRDRFLVLAADAALTAGRPAEADLLLARLLRPHPHHMLRPFATFGEAMASPDIQNYVREPP